MLNRDISDKLFGQVLHKVIKEYITYKNEKWYDNFTTHWGAYRNWKLAYEIGDDWNVLNRIGLLLMKNFVDSYEKLGIIPYLNENKLIYIDDDGNVITRQPDFIGLKDKRLIIVDFKFGRQWTQNEVDQNDQLTEYAMIAIQSLNEKTPIYVAICNLRKADGQVNWMFSQRTKEQIEEFKHRKKNLVLREVF